MHYTDDQLCALLEQIDSDPAHDALTHLEECALCRSRLASLSGEGRWLSDLLDSVGDVTREHPQGMRENCSASSIVVSVDASDAMSQELQCESVRLDFLSPPAHPELLGRLGRYDIERLIGMGGYGIVFRARDSELNRVVAIKVLAPHLMNSGPARQRFAREAQASAAVVHDHVVPIYDVVADGGLCYFVMQYIAGESLQERVDRLGALPIDDVLRIGAQIAGGLHAAHQQGLIHRDVKPGNVLLEDTVNRVMISDFGLARASDDASLTRSGTITGTPHYMSPEQARGQSIDHRSDLFSLGSVLYFMCTGHSPFRAPQMMAVLNRICHEAYRPVEEFNPQVPDELIRIINRLLSKSPESRFESAAEVRQQLQRLLSDFQQGKLRPRRRPTWMVSPRVLKLATAVLCAVALVAAVSWTLSGALQRKAQPARDTENESIRAVVLDDLGVTGAWNAAASAESAESATSASDSEAWTMQSPDAGNSIMLMSRQLSSELAAASASVAALETAATQFSTLVQTDSAWDRERFVLNSLLKQMEDELGVEETLPP